MAFSPHSRLTPLQRDLCEAFFAREQRFFLTGGGALAGIYFGHRDTEDLDLFSGPGPDLELVSRTLAEAANACGATLEQHGRAYPDFRRYVARRGEEECVVDLVIDRAPMVDPQKPLFGEVRVDSLREIAANKVGTLLSRSEPKDLVDFVTIIESGVDLEQALNDASKKDPTADDPATLAWILDEIRLSPGAMLPGGIDAGAVDRFRGRIAARLRALAFERARRGP